MIDGSLILHSFRKVLICFLNSLAMACIGYVYVLVHAKSLRHPVDDYGNHWKLISSFQAVHAIKGMDAIR